MGERSTLGGRIDYFAVNDKPMGVSTSFRVSGRLGELAKRFWSFSDAAADATRINRAYSLGYKDGFDVGRLSLSGESRAPVDIGHE